LPPGYPGRDMARLLRFASIGPPQSESLSDPSAAGNTDLPPEQAWPPPSRPWLEVVDGRCRLPGGCGRAAARGAGRHILRLRPRWPVRMASVPRSARPAHVAVYCHIALEPLAAGGAHEDLATMTGGPGRRGSGDRDHPRSSPAGSTVPAGRRHAATLAAVTGIGVLRRIPPHGLPERPADRAAEFQGWANSLSRGACTPSGSCAARSGCGPFPSMAVLLGRSRWPHWSG